MLRVLSGNTVKIGVLFSDPLISVATEGPLCTRDTWSPPYKWNTGEIAEQPEIQDCRVPRNLKPLLRERFLPPGWIWLMKCFLGTCSMARSTSSSMLSTCTLFHSHHCLFNYISTNISCLFKCFFFDAESRLHHWPRDLSPLPLQQLPSRQPKQERWWDLPCAIQEARKGFCFQSASKQAVPSLSLAYLHIFSRQSVRLRGLSALRKHCDRGISYEIHLQPNRIQRWYIRISYFWTNLILDR